MVQVAWKDYASPVSVQTAPVRAYFVEHPLVLYAAVLRMVAISGFAQQCSPLTSEGCKAVQLFACTVSAQTMAWWVWPLQACSLRQWPSVLVLGRRSKHWEVTQSRRSLRGQKPREV